MMEKENEDEEPEEKDEKVEEVTSNYLSMLTYWI